MQLVTRHIGLGLQAMNESQVHSCLYNRPILCLITMRSCKVTYLTCIMLNRRITLNFTFENCASHYLFYVTLFGHDIFKTMSYFKAVQDHFLEVLPSRLIFVQVVLLLALVLEICSWSRQVVLCQDRGFGNV